MIHLANTVNEEKYFLNTKDGTISTIFVVSESVSGKTIETESGVRIRTDTKRHKVFNNYEIALIGRNEIIG